MEHSLVAVQGGNEPRGRGADGQGLHLKGATHGLPHQHYIHRSQFELLFV